MSKHLIASGRVSPHGKRTHNVDEHTRRGGACLAGLAV